MLVYIVEDRIETTFLIFFVQQNEDLRSLSGPRIISEI